MRNLKNQLSTIKLGGGVKVWIKNNFGYIDYDYKADLNEEEDDESYLPDFYRGCVIELKMIESFEKGGGHKLMEQFLSLPEVKAEKVIFLDCCPLFQEKDEGLVMQSLHDFYGKYGFLSKSDDGYSRQWLFLKLPASEEACFVSGYVGDNDLHPVLMNALSKIAEKRNAHSQLSNLDIDIEELASLVFEPKVNAPCIDM
jgi:hypothetical protein